MTEQGSDEQMTDEQREHARRLYELAQAEATEEERKTAARPDDGEG